MSKKINTILGSIASIAIGAEALRACKPEITNSNEQSTQPSSNSITQQVKPRSTKDLDGQLYTSTPNTKQPTETSTPEIQPTILQSDYAEHRNILDQLPPKVTPTRPNTFFTEAEQNPLTLSETTVNLNEISEPQKDAFEEVAYRINRQVFLPKQTNFLWEDNLVYKFYNLDYPHAADYEGNAPDQSFFTSQRNYVGTVLNDLFTGAKFHIYNENIKNGLISNQNDFPVRIISEINEDGTITFRAVALEEIDSNKQISFGTRYQELPNPTLENVEIIPSIIILHWCGGASTTTNQCFNGLNAGGYSAHFSVDSTEILQMVPTYERTVTATNAAERRGGTAINIENPGQYYKNLIPYDENTTYKGIGTPPLEQSLNTINLIIELMKQYDIPLSHVRGHSEESESGKIDPGVTYMRKMRSYIYARLLFEGRTDLLENIPNEYYYTDLLNSVLENEEQIQAQKKISDDESDKIQNIIED